MKRILTVLLAVLLALSMVACSGSTTGGNPANPGGNTENPGGNTENPGGNTENPGGNTDNPGGNTDNPGGDDEVQGEVQWDKLNEVLDFVLEVENGRDVVVLQLTDIQIIDSSQARSPDRLTAADAAMWVPGNMEILAWSVMRQIVERVNPDLIVLSGDNVYGEFDDNGTVLTALIAEMESYKIPWTLTFGNHDNETKKGMEWTCSQYENAEHCLFKRGPIDKLHGNGNFTIGVKQGDKLSEVIWLMDSNGHTEQDESQNMYSSEGLFEDQIQWFEDTCLKLKEYNGGVMPASIGFFHHPMQAICSGMQKYGYVATPNFSRFLIPENTVGDSGCMNLDGKYVDKSFTFHKLLKKYKCEGWFFGHEHRNNTSVTYEGVRYTFGLKASYYDSYENFSQSLLERDEVGGTKILLGESGLRVSHEYYDTEA